MDAQHTSMGCRSITIENIAGIHGNSIAGKFTINAMIEVLATINKFLLLLTLIFILDIS